ncbi:hypothetical protein HMPREF1863_01169 [Aedoeadaptatus coxii]|uniref:Uncharacterized protein n=1 Tax=Aedoeadaptatus coxii TaxID=755172 RepID=A0A134AE33_9FIRM|nr:hypothetical protein HMPREF1863_01169 [Peptoniphilus coxii]
MQYSFFQQSFSYFSIYRNPYLMKPVKVKRKKRPLIPPKSFTKNLFYFR